MAKHLIEVTVRYPNGTTKHYLLSDAQTAILIPYLETCRRSKEYHNNYDSGGPVSTMGFVKRTYAEFGRAACCLVSSRFNAQMTQKALAAAANVQQSHLSAMERGKRPIGKVIAQRLAKVLKCSWRDLVSE